MSRVKDLMIKAEELGIDVYSDTWSVEALLKEIEERKSATRAKVLRVSELVTGNSMIMDAESLIIREIVHIEPVEMGAFEIKFEDGFKTYEDGNTLVAVY